MRLVSFDPLAPRVDLERGGALSGDPLRRLFGVLEVGYELAVDVELDPGGLAFGADGGTCRWDGRMS